MPWNLIVNSLYQIHETKLEEVAEEMMEIVKDARRVLANDKADDSSHKDAMESMLLDMSDPCIGYIDNYAPHCFGLDVPTRLFWEAYYVRQDCTRMPGSEYDTGRPSQPAFQVGPGNLVPFLCSNEFQFSHLPLIAQDMNFASLRSKGNPRTVLMQHADPDSPMNPFEVLMAYEQDGHVLPVVSDFDCFLVGTRGIRYLSPLPACQLETLQQCVSRIETILDRSSPELRNLNWTSRWLEVLKNDPETAKSPKTPLFGFGDPTSHSIMRNAVDRLKSVGAVRHGGKFV